MTATPLPAANDIRTTYDETPYPSASFPQSHPNRLAAIARLFGVNAKSPSTARVLELGCANGANILPMAEQLPNASFLGIDASRRQSDAGKAAITAAGLKNIEVRYQNILEFSAVEGKFDYIIAHGIYSWVPEPVREKMMAICRDHLSDTGVAYISYNALPGWNMRRSLRDMMLFHTRGMADPNVKVQQARALLKFLAESVPTEKNAYGMLLKSELDIFSKAADNYFRHDILEEENTAFYFHEFCARAGAAGLQYLGEPNLSQMLATNFPDKVSTTLKQVGGNIVAQEQYMDFLRNRMFRQTLLCRNNVQVTRNVGADAMRKYAFQSRLKVQNETVDLAPNTPVSFEAEGGQKLTTSDPFVKAAFSLIAQTPARALGYSALLNEARAMSRANVGSSGPDRERWEDATLANNLFNLYIKGFLEMLVDPVPVSLTVPEKPHLTPLMRHQALHATYVTTRMHQALPVDAMGRYLITLCDGTRDKAQLVDGVADHVIRGNLQVTENGAKVTDVDRVRVLLAPRVDGMLQILARNGFFAP